VCHATTGVATVLLGCVLMHDMVGAPHVAWLLPVLLLLGLALVAGLVAELGKHKVGWSVGLVRARSWCCLERGTCQVIGVEGVDGTSQQHQACHTCTAR
jgi:hypothetical protein